MKTIYKNIRADNQIVKLYIKVFKDFIIISSNQQGTRKFTNYTLKESIEIYRKILKYSNKEFIKDEK